MTKKITAAVAATQPVSKEQTITTSATACACTLFDDRCCGQCRYYDALHSCCSDGTPRSASSWCRSFSY